MDWDRPPLLAVTDWLVEAGRDGSQLDLSAYQVVLGGSRAGRRLIELLLQVADRQTLALSAPRTMTPGLLMDRLLPRGSAVVLQSSVARRMVWAQAVGCLNDDQMQVLAESEAVAQSHVQLALAEQLDGLWNTLAGDGLEFADVLAQLQTEDQPAQEHRWSILVDVLEHYRQILSGLGLIDPWDHRRESLEAGVCRCDGQLVLAGVAEMPGLLRGMLEQVAEQQDVTVLVFSPETESDCFESDGTLCGALWRDRLLPLLEDQIHVALGPADQAQQVVELLKPVESRYRADQISVGVCDDQVGWHLVQKLTGAGVPVRYAAGMTVAGSAPYRLLQGVVSYLEERDYASFAGLLRHPDLLRWLRVQVIGQDADLLTVLDGFYTDCLPMTVDPASIRRWVGLRPGDALRQLHGQWLASTYDAIDQLLQPLQVGGARPISHFSEPLIAILSTMYPVLDREQADGRRLLDACDSLYRVIRSHYELPAAMAEAVPVTGVQAIRMVLQETAGQPIAPEAMSHAVELLGWLELVADDAPCLVVAGVNEQHVPESITADPFLPDSLRSRLKLADNAHRYARDVYAMTVLVHSRENLNLIAGRRSASNDPLIPSRLLLACPAEKLPGRVVRLFDESHAVQPGRHPVGADAGDCQRFVIPEPSALIRPITRLSVTRFRDFLASPYRFYLKHVLKLGSIGDQDQELDAASFGTILHEVLSAFGSEPGLRDCVQVDRLRDWLDDRLMAMMHARYGRDSMPAVRLQIEQMRYRLRRFAEWQCRHRDAGWQLAVAEWQPDEPVGFAVDGQPFGLTGRVDRVDVHESTGQVCVLDYKSSDKAKTPEQTHCKGKDSNRQWVDLQLPLYRHLIQPLVSIHGWDADQPVALGYVSLPKSYDEAPELKSIAQWSEPELAEADEVARAIIRQLRQGETDGSVFKPMGDPPHWSDGFERICQDGMLIGDEDDEASQMEQVA